MFNATEEQHNTSEYKKYLKESGRYGESLKLNAEYEYTGIRKELKASLSEKIIERLKNERYEVNNAQLFEISNVRTTIRSEPNSNKPGYRPDIFIYDKLTKEIIALIVIRRSDDYKRITTEHYFQTVYDKRLSRQIGKMQGINDKAKIELHQGLAREVVVVCKGASGIMGTVKWVVGHINNFYKQKRKMGDNYVVGPMTMNNLN